FATTNGVATNNGNISLETLGALTVNQPVNAGTGASAGVVRLQAAGNGSGTGAISGSSVGGATTSGSINLNGTSNNVGTFAASDTAAGGAITFADAAALTIDTVAPDTNIGFGGATGVAGVTTNDGNISLGAGGALTINQAVNAGPAVGGGI